MMRTFKGLTPVKAPALYCICGTTLVDPEGLTLADAMTCARCKINRCIPCTWKHIRQTHPAWFLELRNEVVLGRMDMKFRAVKS